MLTHVVWDSFTHINGYMVLKFPDLFTHSYNIYGFSIPMYKFLQHEEYNIWDNYDFSVHVL